MLQNDTSHSNFPLSGLEDNLSYSPRDVWAWYVVTVPAGDYSQFAEDAGLPKYLHEQIGALNEATGRKKISFRLMVSSTSINSAPVVLIGVKLGNRKEQNDSLIPGFINKLVNVIADSPIDDYISDKESKYWGSIAAPYNKFFGTAMGFQKVLTNQLAYVIREKFSPGVDDETLSTNINKGTWGEKQINELAKADIKHFPKYLEFIQDTSNGIKAGYRCSLEIVKFEPGETFPEFNAWLPYIKLFPFPIVFTIDFVLQKSEIIDVHVQISLEASTTKQLTENANALLEHYQQSNMFATWTSGDQLSMFNASLPNGLNEDYINRSAKSELSVTAIRENISFSKTDVVAWVTLPLSQIEYLGNAEQERIAWDFNAGLAALVTTEDRNVDCHMLISGRPFESRTWVQRIENKIRNHNPVPYSKTFLTNMYNYVDSQDFRERLVILGVVIGKRWNYNPNKTDNTIIDTIMNVIPATAVPDEITDEEFAHWKSMARPVVRTLENGYLNAVEAEAKDIAFLIRKPFYPSMPVPSPEELSVGIGDEWTKKEIDYLAEGEIVNHSKFLKITQDIAGVEYTGYRATLCFATFPSVMLFPEGDPWIHVASLLPFQTDFSLRFTLEPARKVRNEVGRKVKDFMDQAVNMESAGGSTSIEVQEQLETGEELDYELKKNPTPWVYGRYYITVEGSSEDELKDRCKMVIDHYRAMEIHLKWSSGDQLNLLKSSLPNDKVRVKSYYQRHTLSGISAGIPTGTGTVGDKVRYEKGQPPAGWIGNYIGYTTGQTREPVFTSLHSVIAAGSMPGATACGASGSGKTFGASALVYQTVLSGAWGVFIDPKNDAKNLMQLPGMEKTRLIEMQQGYEGILDPFSIGDDLATQKGLAKDVITIFLGGDQRINDEQNLELSHAINSVTTFPNPSLLKIVDFLVNGVSSAAKALGVRLELLTQMRFSQLCFSKNTAEKLKVSDGLTILSLAGLNLPGATILPENYDNSNRLSVGIMYLISVFTNQLMEGTNAKQPKIIAIDEAWAVTTTAQGRKLVESMARLGRSHNVALLLISQNANDFSVDGVKSAISTKFAFKTEDEEEIENVLTYMGMELSDSNKSTVSRLEIGECLMKDWSGRIASVRIDVDWDKAQRFAYETNQDKKSNR